MGIGIICSFGKKEVKNMCAGIICRLGEKNISIAIICRFREKDGM